MNSLPHVAMLTGRTSWPVVCHADPLICARCRESLAAFFAREIGYDLDAAIARPAALYAADVCGSAEAGHELRRLTAKVCFLRNPWFDGFAPGATADDIVLVDDHFVGYDALRAKAEPDEGCIEVAA